MTQPPSNPDPYDLVPTPPATKPSGGIGFVASLYKPPPLRVRYDLACVHCGYNLRSLSREGNCPECNTPIADSYQGNLLQFANAVWIMQLAIGALLLSAACILHGLTLLAALFSWQPAMFLALGLTACTVDVVGSHLLARREPRTAHRPQRLTPALQWTSVAMLLVYAATVLNAAYTWTSAPLLPALLLVATVKIIMLGTRLHMLALRIPSGGLAAHTLNLTWATAIILLASVPSAYIGFGAIFCIVPIGLVLPPCLLWVIAVLSVFANDFRHCAREAKRHGAARSDVVE